MRLSNCLFQYVTMREKCPYLEFFWSVFSRIRTSFLSVFSPNVANTDQKNYKYGHFLRIVKHVNPLMPGGNKKVTHT